MFSFFTDAIDDTLTLGGKLLNGEDISTRDVAKVASAAATVATGAVLADSLLDLAKSALED